MSIAQRSGDRCQLKEPKSLDEFSFSQTLKSLRGSTDSNIFIGASSAGRILHRPNFRPPKFYGCIALKEEDGEKRVLRDPLVVQANQGNLFCIHPVPVAFLCGTQHTRRGGKGTA